MSGSIALHSSSRRLGLISRTGTAYWSTTRCSGRTMAGTVTLSWVTSCTSFQVPIIADSVPIGPVYYPRESAIEQKRRPSLDATRDRLCQCSQRFRRSRGAPLMPRFLQQIRHSRASRAYSSLSVSPLMRTDYIPSTTIACWP